MIYIILGFLFTVFSILLTVGFSWLITCAIVWLITLCFGWTFSWSVATGVWLIICILNTIFGK